jgi:hypothetical protein
MQRRFNHVGIHRIGFDYLLAAWDIRVSCFRRVIPHFARRRRDSSNFAFLPRERGERIIGG